MCSEIGGFLLGKFAISSLFIMLSVFISYMSLRSLKFHQSNGTLESSNIGLETDSKGKISFKAALNSIEGLALVVALGFGILSVISLPSISYDEHGNCILSSIEQTPKLDLSPFPLRDISSPIKPIDKYSNLNDGQVRIRPFENVNSGSISLTIVESEYAGDRLSYEWLFIDNDTLETQLLVDTSEAQDVEKTFRINSFKKIISVSKHNDKYNLSKKDRKFNGSAIILKDWNKKNESSIWLFDSSIKLNLTQKIVHTLIQATQCIEGGQFDKAHNCNDLSILDFGLPANFDPNDYQVHIKNLELDSKLDMRETLTFFENQWETTVKQKISLSKLITRDYENGLVNNYNNMLFKKGENERSYIIENWAIILRGTFFVTICFSLLYFIINLNSKKKYFHVKLL